MTSAVRIEIAAPQDMKAIFELLLGMHAEIGLVGMDQIKVGQTIQSIVEKGVCLLALDGERIAGAVGLIPDQWWYSREWFLREMWYFVHPDYRRTSAAAMLLKSAKEAAAKFQMPLVASVFTTVDTKPKIAFFARHMMAMGALFIHFPAQDAAGTKAGSHVLRVG